MIRSVNRNGLRRRGYTDEQIEPLKAAYRLLFKDTTPWITQAVELEKIYPDHPDIRTLLAFMRASMSGKFGRAREAPSGGQAPPAREEDEEHPHATGELAARWQNDEIQNKDREAHFVVRSFVT